jgi:hypothetical protein
MEKCGFLLLDCLVLVEQVTICEANQLSYGNLMTFGCGKLSALLERKSQPQGVVVLPKTGIVHSLLGLFDLQTDS